MSVWPIGVFTSIDAGLGVQLNVAHELNVTTIQLHAPAAQTRTADNAANFLDRISDMGIELTAVFGGFEGESYSDIPTVCQTVGLVPENTRAARLAEMKEISDFARQLKCDVVALHLGFVPEEPSDPCYEQIVDVTRDLLDYVAGNNQSLHLETGQETANGLLQFIQDVDRDNLFVNFDPANMILYGTGKPLEALQQINSKVRSIHCKDAKWATNPGKEWGTETPLGDGDVDMKAFLQTLHNIGYTGPLTIEREIPQEPERQKQEIGHAVQLLTSLREEILG